MHVTVWMSANRYILMDFLLISDDLSGSANRDFV
jgi:hypothetical protein